MKLGDFVEPGFVVLGVRPGPVESVLRQLVAPLVADGTVREEDEVLAELTRRERLQSTGIGSGVAVPHCICDELDTPRVVIGVCPPGTEYHALDERPVHVLFLLLSPASEARTHVRILARVARLSRRSGVLETIRTADEPADVVEALRDG